jgi:hypothetical protein
MEDVKIHKTNIKVKTNWEKTFKEMDKSVALIKMQRSVQTLQVITEGFLGKTVQV